VGQTAEIPSCVHPLLAAFKDLKYIEKTCFVSFRFGQDWSFSFFCREQHVQPNISESTGMMPAAGNVGWMPVA